MNKIDQRRVTHLKRLEAEHKEQFGAQFGTGKSQAQQKHEEISDAASAAWNRQQKLNRSASFQVSTKPLPIGWRNEHWKTQQAMAADYAGVEAPNKDAAVKALEEYEEALHVPGEGPKAA